MVLDNLFIYGQVPATAIKGYYNLHIVSLSYMVAFLGCYVTLDLTGRLLDTPSIKNKEYWILACSILMGCSIWSMHFIGMLAYIMPMSITYDPWWTGFSLLIAIIGSIVAFYFIKSEKGSILKFTLSGIFMGLCIASMHYTGMQAMEGVNMPMMLYIPWIFLLSIVIAIVVSIAAIWILIQSSQGSMHHQFQLKIFSALIMAAAICSMHYTGMAAVIFVPMSPTDLYLSLIHI